MTPHHAIPTHTYSQNVGWSRSDWIVESIQIYYSMEYIRYISCTFSHVIVLYYDIDERRNTWWIHLSSRAGTSGTVRSTGHRTSTTRAGHRGTINDHVNSSRIGTQCGGNGTGQLIIRQTQVGESCQTCQCGGNGTGQLILIQTQACE